MVSIPRKFLVGLVVAKWMNGAKRHWPLAVGLPLRFVCAKNIFGTYMLGFWPTTAPFVQSPLHIPTVHTFYKCTITMYPPLTQSRAHFEQINKWTAARWEYAADNHIDNPLTKRFTH